MKATVIDGHVLDGNRDAGLLLGNLLYLDGILRAFRQWLPFLGEFLGLVLIFVGFLVSEDVFRNVRLGTTLWSRAPSASLESEVG